MIRFFRNKLKQETRERLAGDHLRFHIAADAKASPHPEGVVLINLRTGMVFSANRAGALIWKAVVERSTLGRIAERISAEFHIPVPAARQDAVEFLAQLRAEGLLAPDAQ